MNSVGTSIKTRTNVATPAAAPVSAWGSEPLTYRHWPSDDVGRRIDTRPRLTRC